MTKCTVTVVLVATMAGAVPVAALVHNKQSTEGYLTFKFFCETYPLCFGGQSVVAFLWRQKEWALLFCANITTRGHNTNNFANAIIRVLNDMVLNRTEAFNGVALVDAVAVVWERHFESRILCHAHSHVASHQLTYKRLLRMPQGAADSVKPVGDVYAVPSAAHHGVGHNTNNFAKATISDLNHMVLNRTEAFSAMALVDVVTAVWERYFESRILHHAHSRVASHQLAYKQNTQAWMACSLFEVLPRYLDRRLGNKDRKGLPFLDNCSAHPKDTSFLCNLIVVFLRGNTTSHLQPLDAGIIKNVKHLYRKCIVRRFLAHMSRGEKHSNLVLLNAMHYLSTSWKWRSPEQCVSGDPDPCMSDDDTGEELRSAGMELAFSDFVVHDDVPTCEPQTIADIVAKLQQGQVSGDEHDDDEDEPETPPGATFAQAIAALDELKSYFDTKDNPAAEGGLQTLQKELFLPKSQGVHQQKLTDVSEK
ncbi:centromere protein B, putative [Ixodes scapularis]|uniref:Centromere protein B, putative n=1 Tax=Ixodes scapularis TaxID=6945 RepID=B7QLE2_IXOSC|nr:centromere protein B, putative [Ixodes scapularis]|eukprot:XP_002415997.1 centromere protein B, putative [Ixodes scapularis]